MGVTSKRTVNKRSRVQGDSVCNLSTCNKIPRTCNADTFRQSHGLEDASKACGTASLILQKLTLNIQKLCNEHHLTVLYQHIAGKPNTETDALSQIQQQIHHHALLKAIFRKIEYHWIIKLKVDAFVSSTNKKLNKYWSWNQDLGAEAVDTFKQRWLRKDMYLYFLWKLMS
ncbi:hypothetical protein RMATCC62417_05924 [Rhizopus microsporus]|nr:hypothetical protein RMATCC62417_05924 [Rhizopus microsporus]